MKKSGIIFVTVFLLSLIAATPLLIQTTTNASSGAGFITSDLGDKAHSLPDSSSGLNTLLSTGPPINRRLSTTELPIPDPSTELAWYYNGSSQLNSLGDVDGDGQIEMVMSNFSMAGGRQVISIWKYDSMNNAWNMWEYDEVITYQVIARALDLDHDGTAELLLDKRLTSSAYSHVVVIARWTETGLVELTNEFTISGGLSGGPAVYDFDDDGVDEISICSGYTSGSSTWILDWTGTSLTETWRRNFGSTWMGDTLIANIDDEPGMELVIIEGRDGRFEIYDWTGTTFTLLLQTTIDLGWVHNGLRDLFVDDFNQNGINEIVIGTGWHHVGDENIDAYLIVYEWTGTSFEQIYWSPDYRRQLYWGIQADLTGDGVSELILNYGEDFDRPDADPHVSIRKWNGTAFAEIWRWSVERPTLCAVADVDSDGRPELYATDRPYHDVVFWQWTGMFPLEQFPHAPIVINGDEDFVNQAWPGSGTPENPYRIMNFFIDLESTPGYCVAIYNTRAHFVVHNCVLTGATNWGIPHDLGGGVLLDNVENGKLKNNTCHSNGCGILLENSNANTLENNTCSNNDWIGLRLRYSDSNTLNNNTALSNDYYGFSLDYSDFNTLTDTISVDNSVGLYLWGSYSNVITKGTFIDNMWSGVYFQYSGDNTLTESTFISCGLRITTNYLLDARQKQITDNTVNGQPLLFIRDQVGGSVTGPAGQIVLVNCTEVIVENYQLSDCSIGIDLVFTDQSIIQNNIISDNIHCGIELWYSIQNLVQNNTCTFDGTYGGVYGGIFLYHGSTGNRITNNTCSGNKSGINLFGASVNRLINNTLTNNGVGISLASSTSYNFINWNRFFDNLIQAIDDGLGNEFDFNYYSDYTGSDINFDGIGDTPYDITGTAENQDLHPLMYSFGILARRDIKLELSGSFDFLEKEEIHLQLAALLTDSTTGEPKSGATITATIYDPDGLELLIVALIEEIPGSGVYIYRSPFTLKDAKWPKGIYVVYAQATVIDHDIIVGEAVDMLQFHIDPPGELNTTPLPIHLWIIITIIGLAAIGLSAPLIQRWRHRQLPRPL